MTLQKTKRRYLTAGILGVVAIGLLAPMTAFGALDKSIEELCENAKGPIAILCDKISLLEEEIDVLEARIAELEPCDHSGEDLSGQDLSGQDFSDCDLTNADLTDADLSNADLTDADLTGAVIFGVDLTDATLGSFYIDDTFLGNEETIWYNSCDGGVGDISIGVLDTDADLLAIIEGTIGLNTIEIFGELHPVNVFTILCEEP